MESYIKQEYIKHRKIIKYIKIVVLKKCGYHKIRSGWIESVHHEKEKN